jgi:hypothetical protein
VLIIVDFAKAEHGAERVATFRGFTRGRSV